MNMHAEFIDEMSKSEKREIKNRLSVVIEHVLKLNYVQGRIAADNSQCAFNSCASGWKNSAQRERRALGDLFNNHPGLKPELTELLVNEVHRMAVADLQVRYPHVQFPRTRQLSTEEIVGRDVVAMLGR